MCDILKTMLTGSYFFMHYCSKVCGRYDFLKYNLIIDTFIQQGCVISDKNTFVILQNIFYFK